MATHGAMFRVLSLAGNCSRNALYQRTLVPYVPCAGAKKSIESKLGLPERPKKPLTPYFRFLQEIRPELQKNNPTAKTTELIRKGAKLWSDVLPAKKATLQQEFERDTEKFSVALAQYKSQLSDEHKEMIANAQRERKETHEKIQRKRKLRELGRPRKPATGFLYFVAEKKNERGDIPTPQWVSELAARWKQMTDAEKERYTSKQLAALEIYKKDLNRWEEEMVRQGHLDVVREDSRFETMAEKMKKPKKRATEKEKEDK